LKKDKSKYINLAKCEETPDGDTPKPLKDKYLTEDKNGDYVSKVKKETIYHNTSQKIGLYTQTALSEGQTFKGTITGTGKDLNQIKKHFKNKSIRVGKSKTAQYAYCSIHFDDVIEAKEPIKSDKIAVILKSDVLILKDSVYTTDICELKKALNISGKLNKDKTSLAYTTISGYSGVYNLKKPQAKAFKAGSVLIFENVDNTKEIPAKFIIGERRGEGFGVCEMIAVEDMRNIMKKENVKDDIKENGTYRTLLEKNKSDVNLKEKAIIHAKQNSLNEVITATQIGRLRRMLAESKNYDDFKARIDSIKTDSIKKAAQDYFTEKNDFKLFWDTVLLYHRFKRKIDEKKEANNK